MNMNYLSSALVIVLVASSASLAAPKAKKNEIKDARDKQKYRTVVIDGRKWMADNLNYSMPGSTCYREDEDNCMVYGRLYTWEAAQKACPAGFHLPTNEEFESLWKAAGGDFNAGYLIKANYGWSGETNGNDTLKFSAMPAGNMFDDGTYGNENKFAFFWSSSTEGGDASVWYLSSKSMGFSYMMKPKNFGFSVRCVE
ncbi:fibrobacter succinogenes major paralogous domain-containing protein [Fibrobacter sp. UWB13]|uniref:fibrobacter succinogenes major paralogous domain-containing protein n=1 Tax=Fibrobacter sp. UWB13 TaxID=1896204 RepID=UPI000A0C0A32|nr:fibrobacter succinogenes major paralogous domain-containing protein [Fibrobacter sp. UWB13]SMG42568.1 major paralogous domain-containing protein [Fibrobacter sp. UWB13]